MNIEELNLRKCEIKYLSPELQYFIVTDMYDNSEINVFLSGKQRMSFADYKVGSIIYAAKSVKNEWRLVTGTNFKMNTFLSGQKELLDRYFDELKT